MKYSSYTLPYLFDKGLLQLSLTCVYFFFQFRSWTTGVSRNLILSPVAGDTIASLRTTGRPSPPLMIISPHPVIWKPGVKSLPTSRDSDTGYGNLSKTRLLPEEQRYAYPCADPHIVRLFRAKKSDFKLILFSYDKKYLIFMLLFSWIY